MKNNSLFSMFPPVSNKAWKQKIQADLKGADYNKSLIWKSAEGIDVKPFYNADDVKKTQQFPTKRTKSWSICEVINEESCSQNNAKALTAISMGAERIHFIINNVNCNLTTLLNKIDLNKIPIYFELQLPSLELVIKLNKIVIAHNAKFYVLIDIIGHLARTGNWYFSLKEDHSRLANILAMSKNLKSVFLVDMAKYQNAGGTMVQQLAFAMAHLNEYINHYGSKIGNIVVLKNAIGSNYFFEIAKLRALPLLWNAIVSEYRIACDYHILSRPSRRNKTIYDYNINMLRTTTECMSAILGGSQGVSNLPYNSAFNYHEEFGERIARNQLLILKHECYFGKVNNPTDGAYFIESLTRELSEQALCLFKEIERNGGFYLQLKSGAIQQQIRESANRELQRFKKGEMILTGVNKHRNDEECIKSSLVKRPFSDTNKKKTFIEPIREKRIAGSAEQERIYSEKKN